MMIHLNLATRPASLPALTPAPQTPVDTSISAPSRSQSAIKSALASGDNSVEALQKRIKQLKKRIERLQQQLRQANARMEAVKAARYRNEEAKISAVMAAKGQVVALTSAVSVALSALFQAEKMLIGNINLSV